MKQRVFIDGAALCGKRLSGVGQVTLETIRALAKDDKFLATHQMVLIVSRKDSQHLARHKLDERVKVRIIPLPTKVWNALNRFDIVPWADLLFGTGVYVFPNFRNWRLLRSKSITYIHDIAFILHPDTVSPRNLSYLKKNVSAWLNRTDTVVTVSQSSKQEIVDHFRLSQEFVSVIPNAVNGNVYSERPKEEVDRVLKHVGIKGDYVLFVGNIEPRKNLLNLVEAFTYMSRSERSKIELVIIGAGGWLNDEVMSSFETAVRKGVRVTRPSFFVDNNELACLYTGARLAVLPSIHEGFGMPILEALACGTRVAASKVPALIEVGRDMISYFNPHDPAEMGRVIARELRKPALNRIEKTQLHEFAVHHNWADSADLLELIINHLEKNL